jgi:hypothetical protein
MPPTMATTEMAVMYLPHLQLPLLRAVTTTTATTTTTIIIITRVDPTSLSTLSSSHQKRALNS